MTAQERFDHQLAIMQAIKEGKTVQLSGGGYGCNWRDWDGIPPTYKSLNFQDFEWRIKPEPIELEFWYIETTSGPRTKACREQDNPNHWPGQGWRKIKMREVLED